MGRKPVAPGHVVENSGAPANENSTALDTLQEPEAIYAPGMAPLANDGGPENPQGEPPAEESQPETSPGAPQTTQVDPEEQSPDTSTLEIVDATEGGSDALCLVVLKNGRTFCFRGQLFRKGEPTATEPETAERLVRSGYFERG